MSVGALEKHDFMNHRRANKPAVEPHLQDTNVSHLFRQAELGLDTLDSHKIDALQQQLTLDFIGMHSAAFESPV